MKLIDLSQPVYDGSPNCPVHPPVKSEILRDHPTHGWRVEVLTLSNHTGSHVDAPLHKIAGGASLDDIPLERFAGPARIADLRGIGAASPITVELLKAKLPVGHRRRDRAAGDRLGRQAGEDGRVAVPVAVPRPGRGRVAGRAEGPRRRDRPLLDRRDDRPDQPADAHGPARSRRVDRGGAAVPAGGVRGAGTVHIHVPAGQSEGPHGGVLPAGDCSRARLRLAAKRR